MRLTHAGQTLCDSIGPLFTINPLEHRHDIAFLRLDGVKPSEGLVQRRVIAIEMGLFASPELLQRLGDPASLQALALLPLLCSARESEWQFAAANGASERVPLVAPRLISSNSDVRRQAAVAGVGVARLPAFFAEAAVADMVNVRCTSPNKPQPRSLVALW